MADGGNDFIVQNLYEFSDMQFRVFGSHYQCPTARSSSSTPTPTEARFDTEGRLTGLGDLEIDGTVSSPATDLAEYYPIAGELEPGDVVAFVGDGLQIARADTDNFSRIAGIVSSKPGLTLGISYTDETTKYEAPSDIDDANRFIGDDREFWIDRLVLHEIQANKRAPLALAGRVPVKVSDENGPIQAGDLLTLSSVPGHAMRATDDGPVIGTALQSWEQGEGKIIVLANLGWYSNGSQAARVDELEAQVKALATRLESLVAPASR